MIGEHIRALKAGRWVHAIDCGDETVLHLAEEPAPARVRRAYRPEFVAGAATVEVVTHRERTFPPAEVVRRGYSRAADPALAAMFAGSESFAEWCTSGRILPAAGVPANGAPAAPAATAGGGRTRPGPEAGRAPKAKTKRPAPRKAKAGRRPALRKPRGKARRAAPRKAAAPRKRARGRSARR
jgi:hypothetical protein